MMGSAALVCVRSRSVLSVVIRATSRQEKSPRRPRLRDGTRGACAHAPARRNTRASRLHSTEPCGTPAPSEESCAPSAPPAGNRPVRGRPFPQARDTNGQGVPTSAGLIRVGQSAAETGSPLACAGHPPPQTISARGALRVRRSRSTLVPHRLARGGEPAACAAGRGCSPGWLWLWLPLGWLVAAGGCRVP